MIGKIYVITDGEMKRHISTVNTLAEIADGYDRIYNKVMATLGDSMKDEARRKEFYENVLPIADALYEKLAMAQLNVRTINENLAEKDAETDED